MNGADMVSCAAGDTMNELLFIRDKSNVLVDLNSKGVPSKTSNFNQQKERKLNTTTHPYWQVTSSGSNAFLAALVEVVHITFDAVLLFDNKGIIFCT